MEKCLFRVTLYEGPEVATDLICQRFAPVVGAARARYWDCPATYIFVLKESIRGTPARAILRLCCTNGAAIREITAELDEKYLPDIERVPLDAASPMN